MSNNHSAYKTAFYRAIAQLILVIMTVLPIIYWSKFSVTENPMAFWLIMAVLIALPIIGYRWYKNHFKNDENERDEMYDFFFNGLKIAIVVLLGIGLFGIWYILDSHSFDTSAVFKAIGLGIVMIWGCIFLGYFVWAIYFYNINLGLTETEWDKINKAKSKKRAGDFYSESDLDDEPKYNPYKDETFGLPSGTVRGMIAFTLLFGALSLLVVSMGMNNEISPNSILWDQFEFFKTAFLMMIAFYFGSRSLEYLYPKNKSANPEIPLSTPIANRSDLSATIPSLDVENVPRAVALSEQTISTEVFDPMKPNK